MEQHSYNYRNTIPLFLVGCLVMIASVLRGQTIYTGPNNGDWSTATNWSNGLPTVGNEPTIVGGTIVCINGSLTINYAVTNFGSIINKGATTLSGSISSGGALENQGTFTISSGATMTSSGGFTNSGTLTNNGNVNSNSPLTNTATGVFNNHATWSQNGAATNDGIMSNKAGTLSCPATFTNNNTVENLSGATWKVDFGGSYTNNVGSTLTNGGNFQNLGTFTNNTTVTNSGTFTNNGIHTCNGIFNNESGGRLESTATVNVAGRINNKLGATIISSFKFNVLATGYVSNLAQFTNANMIEITDGGTFCVETLSTLTGQFGSVITNNGYFKVAASATVTTNGSITNTNRFDIFGTYDAMGGGQIINSDSLCNYGLVKNVNVINNSAVWKNFGTTENNSGGVWTNTGRIENQKGAIISNNYEIFNKPSGVILNNGTFNNIIRVFNEGLITNNAYFLAAGDVINKVGGILTNTEVFVIREGSVQNEGTVNNQKTFINETCSIISNKAGGVINNTGRFENKGIIFQRGTLTGNAILALSGHIQGAGSNAPSICQTTLSSGTDAFGEAKVYGQSGFKSGIGIDECAGFQYFANDVNRYVYHCNQIGQNLSTNFKIITRTGDSLTCTVPTTIFDNVAPLVSNCPTDVSIYTTANTAVHTWPPVTGVDNCGDVPTVVETHTSGTAFPIGTTQVTSSVRDSRNNSTDCIFKVNVIKVFSTATCPTSDAAAPVFANCPTSQTINTNGGSAVAVWTTPSVSDNCYPVTVRQNLNSGIAFPLGTNTVTYTATDPTGNVGTCSFNITVNGTSDPCATDNIKPVLANCPANFFGTVNAAINGAVGYWAAPTATDNCGAVTVTGTAVSGSIFNVGTTNVVYTATDAKGNTASCSFTVNVAGANPCPGDVTGPVLTCPANVNVSTSGTSATVTWTAPTATDACSPVVLNGSHQPGNVFKLGTTTVTYCASDVVGNTSKCTFNVNVNNPCLNDTQAPTLTACPASQTINSTNGSNATATWTAPTATDNCTLAGVTSNYTSGSTFGIGTTNVIYTATDVSGNTATCSFGITVNVSNVATCAGNIVLNQSFESNFANWTNGGAGTTIVNDANSGSQAVSICGDNQILRSQPYAVIGGTYTLTVRAKTTAASSSAFVGIDFLDATGAVITTARVLRGVTTTAYATYTMTGTAPANAVNISVFAYKTGTPCLIVDDYCLTNPCTNDTQAPSFTSCPVNQTINITGTANTAVATWTAPTASDNCGTPAVVNNFPSGTAFPLGTTTVTYVATDAKGLKSTCSFTITVVNPCATDAIPPSFGTTCPANQTLTSATGACVTTTWTAPTATDNCGTPSVSSTHTTAHCFVVGTTTVVYTAVDAKLNSATCSFTVTVNNACATETTPPTFTYCPPAQTKVTATTCATTSWTAASATDNCSTPTLTFVTSPTAGLTNGGCFPLGTTTVTYTATDARNNKSTCSFTVAVTQDVCLGDVTAPSFGTTCPTNKSAVSTNGLCVPVNFTAPTATDNCGTPSVSGTHATNFCFPIGTTTVTYTAVDSKNNKSTCSFTVTITSDPCATDVTKPTLSACPANQTLTTTNNACKAATWTAPTATDNCGTPSVTSTHASGFCFPVGTTTVIYTAKDTKNNTATCSFTVTVNNSTCFGGLVGYYYNTNNLTGSPVLQRQESINFDWATNAPATGVNAENFSVRWLGSILAPTTGVVTFKTTTDDGVRLWVNDQLIIDKWVAQSITPWTGSISLVAGQKYSIKMEYNELTGSAAAKLFWSYPGMAEEIVPSSNLCSDPCATDVTKPVLSACPANQTLTTTNNACKAATWTAPTATDNCGTPSVTSSHASGFCFPVGATTVTYTATDAKNNTATCSFTVTVTNSITPTTCGGNPDQLIWKGNIDYVAIGNTMSMSEDRSNCGQYASSSRVLTLPAGATIKAAYLYWSGSGALDNNVTLNGYSVTAQGSKTFYEPSWGMSFFGARADVSNIVRTAGTYSVSNLTWNNTGNYCTANSAYGAWSMVVVYEQAGLTYSTVHINTDNFRMTFPAGNYSSAINCINVPVGCASNAKLTIIAFEGDAYKGEYLYINGAYQGNNLFYGSSGPNLDIRTFNVASHVYAGKTSLSYYFNTYYVNTIWGGAIEGLFDYVKVLKYNTCSATSNLATAKAVLDMQAHAEPNRARIEWVNNYGFETDYFVVEKMNEKSGQFEKISVHNAFNSDQNEHYSDYDNNPQEGDNIYRIAANRYDGSISYSEPKKVSFNNLLDVRVFPNPADEVLNIDLKAYEGRAVGIQIYNTLGKLIVRKQVDKATASPIQMPTNEMPVGSYLIRLLPEGKREVTKQVKIAR